MTTINGTCIKLKKIVTECSIFINILHKIKIHKYINKSEMLRDGLEAVLSRHRQRSMQRRGKAAMFLTEARQSEIDVVCVIRLDA